LKAVLGCCCYGLAGASIVLGVLMLIAGKLVLGIEAFFLGAILFMPVGYFFDLQSRHKASQQADAPAEAGD
jgi:hypothetical protein